MRASSFTKPSSADLDYEKEVEKRRKSYISEIEDVIYKLKGSSLKSCDKIDIAFDIKLDFSKYAGTYSISEAKDLISKMEEEIECVKKEIKESSIRLKAERKISDKQKAFEHNKDIPYIQFEEDNNYKFGMDFGFYKNIPSNVRFYPKEISNGSVTFIGIGYGILDGHREEYGLIGDYGNGFIYVFKSEIPHLMKEVEEKMLKPKNK